MRILDVVSTLDPSHGGVAEGIRQMSGALRRLGHAHEVATLDGAHDPWLADFPATMHVLGPRYGRHAHAPRLPLWLERHAAHFDAVVVHGLWEHHGRAVRHALRGTGTPYFVFPHGMLDPWFRRHHPVRHLKKLLYWTAFERRVLEDAAAVLYTSRAEAELAPQSFGRFDARSAVVGHGVARAMDGDASVFFDAHPELRGRRLVLYLGRLDPKKGCDLLIDAFAAHARTDALLHLLMAGPDAIGWQSSLQQRARAAGIGHRVSWLGMVQGAMKGAVLRAAEVFVLPSHQENFGVAVAEALAAGLPVLLSTQVNTWREIVDDGAGHAAADTSEGTNDLLMRWLSLSAPARERMAACAIACHARRFDVDAVAVRLVGALERARLASPTAAVHGLAT